MTRFQKEISGQLGDYWQASAEQDVKEAVIDADKNVFLSLKDITYVDIDNDGILEILVQEPTDEADVVCVYKYANGNLEGEINVEVKLKK